MAARIIILLILLFFSNAQAEEKYDDATFKDWNSVVDILFSKGIEVSGSLWKDISSKCSGFKDVTSQIPYNKCLYNKALDYKKYIDDVKYCTALAEQKYFEFIKPTLFTTMQFRDSDGKVISAINENTAVLNNNQIYEFKKSAKVVCLRDAGWNNPDSWQDGRR